MDLLNKKCVPCEGGVKPLSGASLQALLKEVGPAWQLLEEKAIERDFKFKNFREAMDFVNAVAKLAEIEGHHPDIDLHGWNKVRITLSTHAIGGLSENDFIVAKKIDFLIL